MLVASLTKKESQKKMAKRRYMTKQDLLVKYNDDKALVDDLVKRKVASNLWMWNPEFPEVEDHRLYLCFDSQVVEDNNVTESSIKVELQAELDKNCEDGRGALSTFFAQGPSASSLLGGDSKAKGSGRANKKKNDGEKKNNSKPVGPSSERVCRQRLRELGVLKTECKAWPGHVDDAEELPCIKEALKKDMGAFVDRLQKQYDTVENTIINKGNDEALSNVLQETDALVKEYAKASEYCRKLIAQAKPKAKAKAKTARAKQ